MLSKAISFAIPPYVRYFVILTLLAVAFISGLKYGGSNVEARYLKAASEERQRQENINEEIRAEYKRREAALLSRIAERNERIKDLLEEAASDPDAGRDSIGVDSVRRLNSID